jgi:hypothetical protein
VIVYALKPNKCGLVQHLGQKQPRKPSAICPFISLKQERRPGARDAGGCGAIEQLYLRFWWAKSQREILKIVKSETRDREANRTYRDCTAESKYLSAVGPSEKELELIHEALN